MLKLSSEKKWLSGLFRLRFTRVIYIALCWSFIDLIVSFFYYYGHPQMHEIIAIRFGIALVLSVLFGYIFIFGYRNFLTGHSLAFGLIIKALLLVIGAVSITLLIFTVESFFLNEYKNAELETLFFNDQKRPWLFFKRTLYWIIVFLATKLFSEINDKYSPGVFFDFLRGKYRQAKNEDRIIMFIDLKDSTPIAEKLGHEDYFGFIREFIKMISLSIIDHKGLIYQYVGDEIVVSWLTSKNNCNKALATVVDARKNIQKRSEWFRRKYDIVPEFRVGIHTGDVTIGEIGIVKKDLAMSGDTMNTSARIRSACNELNQKFLVSKEFVECAGLQPMHAEHLGNFELKGKSEHVALYSLKI
ncbi:MAG: adenylate/guanylate cyclase domain-containing protein [Sphingobacteriales bacterium]|nr:MAG: adenylate/guanylate cyclase domain-containing protein [Sphingobacteriales bacterium]